MNKKTKELINTGGAFSHISLSQTGEGYMTPTEWHQELLSCQANNNNSDNNDDYNNDKNYIYHYSRIEKYSILTVI